MKFVPLIVTVVPTLPLTGENELIVGAGAVTEKLLPLVAVPPPVVTVMGPDVAPAGTVALICVSELTVKLAEVPLNVTALAPVKAVPLIATDIPTGPLAGENELIEGAAGAVTSKFAELVAVPLTVVTEIGPVVAPLGTVAVICVSEFTVYDDVVPLKVTDEAPVNAVPIVPR